MTAMVTVRVPENSRAARVQVVGVEPSKPEVVLREERVAAGRQQEFFVYGGQVLRVDDEPQ